MDSSPSRAPSLSYAALRRQSSKAGAVCVDAHVRICAGGGQQWSSLPRQPLVLVRTFSPCYLTASRRSARKVAPISGIHASLQRLQQWRLAERAASKAVTTDRTAQSLR